MDFTSHKICNFPRFSSCFQAKTNVLSCKKRISFQDEENMTHEAAVSLDLKSAAFVCFCQTSETASSDRVELKYAILVSV